MAVAPMVERCVSECRGFFTLLVIHNGKKKGKFRSFSEIGRKLGFTLIKTAPFGQNEVDTGDKPSEKTGLVVWPATNGRANAARCYQNRPF